MNLPKSEADSRSGKVWSDPVYSADGENGDEDDCGPGAGPWADDQVSVLRPNPLTVRVRTEKAADHQNSS